MNKIIITEEQFKYFLKEEILNETMVVYFLFGLPGSGKSTWCKQNHPELPVVSRDIIRAELGYTKDADEKAKLEFWKEETVTKREYEYIKQYLEEKQSFIIDDTNLRAKFRKKMLDTLRKNGAYVIGVVFNTDLNTCISRRQGCIDAEILKIMYASMDYLKEDEVDEIIEV